MITQQEYFWREIKFPILRKNGIFMGNSKGKWGVIIRCKKDNCISAVFFQLKVKKG